MTDGHDDNDHYDNTNTTNADTCAHDDYDNNAIN